MSTIPLRFGAFMSPLHPPGTDPSWLMADDLAFVEHLDRAGFEEVWVGEHHSGGWGTISSPELFLAAAAERTRHIRLGTGVVSLPYHHPYMVASRIVQLDHMTRGRVMLGVGAGSLPSDAHMLGIEPDQQRPRTADALESVLHLLRDDAPLTRRTDWFELHDAQLQLRPYSADLEIAISSASSPFSMQLAGRLGVHPLSFGAAKPGTDPMALRGQWAHADRAAADAGRTIDRSVWRIAMAVHVADSREEALAQARPGFDRWLHEYFGGLTGLPVTPEGVEPGRELEAQVASGAAIVGTPADAIEAIEALQERSGGFGRLLVIAQDWARPQERRHSFELLARHVVPHFSGALHRVRASNTWVTEHRGILMPKAVAAYQKVAATPVGMDQPPAVTSRPPTGCPAGGGSAPAYPFAPPDRLEPDSHWAGLREGPLARITLPFGGQAWLATRYEDVRTVFADPRFSRQDAVADDKPRFFPVQPPKEALLSLDGPEHSRLRRLVARTFGARQVATMRAGVQALADELVDAILERGAPAELVEDYALPFAVGVIGQLLGVPAVDRHRFGLWSSAVLSTTAFPAGEASEHKARLREYIAGLVAQRSADDTDDVIGHLVVSRDEDEALSDDQLVLLAEGILVAGFESTASQIPNFVYTLFRHPELMEKLRQQPEMVPDAVEEMLRFVPIGAVDGMPRAATEDIELGGVLVKAGDIVMPSMGAANRDPAVFTEPDQLDVSRTRAGHLAFGHGPHHCLGAPLARMELDVALTTLLRRFPGLRLARPEAELSWKSGLIVRGVTALPVTW